MSNLQQLHRIDPKNPNYYNWGLNCQYLELNESDTARIIYDETDQDNIDMFYEGYYSFSTDSSDQRRCVRT